MKKVYQILFSILLFFMLAWETVVTINLCVNEYSRDQQILAEATDLYSVVTDHFLAQPSVPVTTIYHPVIDGSTGSGYKVNVFAGIVRFINQLHNTWFVQYIGRADNFLINYRKADLLYPFQYFW